MPADGRWDLIRHLMFTDVSRVLGMLRRLEWRLVTNASADKTSCVFRVRTSDRMIVTLDSLTSKKLQVFIHTAVTVCNMD